MDERVRKFIEVNSDDVGSVREEVAPYLGMSLEERGRWVSRALRGLGTFLRAQPERRRAILEWEDRRSPESEALWLRLIREARSRG